MGKYPTLKLKSVSKPIGKEKYFEWRRKISILLVEKRKDNTKSIPPKFYLM
jgi:Fe-S cluster biosynthesis and repair protein YggX